MVHVRVHETRSSPRLGANLFFLVNDASAADFKRCRGGQRSRDVAAYLLKEEALPVLTQSPEGSPTCFCPTAILAVPLFLGLHWCPWPLTPTNCHAWLDVNFPLWKTHALGELAANPCVNGRTQGAETIYWQ